MDGTWRKKPRPNRAAFWPAGLCRWPQLLCETKVFDIPKWQGLGIIVALRCLGCHTEACPITTAYWTQVARGILAQSSSGQVTTSKLFWSRPTRNKDLVQVFTRLKYCTKPNWATSESYLSVPYWSLFHNHLPVYGTEEIEFHQSYSSPVPLFRSVSIKYLTRPNNWPSEHHKWPRFDASYLSLNQTQVLAVTLQLP